MAYYRVGGSTTGGSKKIIVGDGIKLTTQQHDELVMMLVSRLMGFNQFRGPIVERFRAIDKELSGHMLPNSEDQQRIRDNRRGKGPKTIDENIQFALMQLDEAVTFLLGVYAPDGGMYSAITSKDEQPLANGCSALMNKHARVFKHYRNLAKALLDMFKFNVGGHWVDYVVELGNKIKGEITTGVPNILLNQIVKEGNELIAVDPYNFLYDPAVYPVDIAAKGEFAAGIDLIRPFKINQYNNSGFYYTADRCNYAQGKIRFYEAKPVIMHQYLPAGTTATNWDQLFTQKFGTGGMGTDNPDAFADQSVERCVINIWLNPKRWGLSGSDGQQIWRFHLLNSEFIVRAEQLVNVHGKLPVVIGMPNEDGLNLQSRTFAEMLLPFQRFASSQINVHQRAARKRLFGLTIYNRNIIPLLENEDLGGGKVPANPAVADYDLNKAILQFNDAPDTSESMKDVDNALQLMQRILPTTQAQQVASMERATRYQAASFVQASNKRNLKLAKLIDDQALDTSRQMQVTNILQFGKNVKVIDEQTGEIFEVNVGKLRDMEMEFAIADGLRGLDKLMIIESLQDVINMLLQSQVARDYDIGALIGYFMELQGEKFDFSQFKYKSPIDALGPEEKALAFQLYQQAVQAAAVNKGQPAAGGQQQQVQGKPGMVALPGA